MYHCINTCSSCRQSIRRTERRIELPCQEEPPILRAGSASSFGSCGRSGIIAAGGSKELLETPGPGLARVGGGLGGEGGGSGRRKSEAAGVEMRRGGPRGDGPGREEERKGGRHGHGRKTVPAAAACYGPMEDGVLAFPR